MKLIKRTIKLPAYILVGSFFGLIFLMGTTNPNSRIVVSALFFILLFTFLIAGGYVYEATKKAKPSSIEKFRIIIVSLFIVIAAMFRSSQSLGWVDALILLLSIWGIIFYANRRFR